MLRPILAAVAAVAALFTQPWCLFHGLHHLYLWRASFIFDFMKVEPLATGCEGGWALRSLRWHFHRTPQLEHQPDRLPAPSMSRLLPCD
jgi:hypothetical protein